MDYTKYLDKKPSNNYALGPTGSGIMQSQPFRTEWSGQFTPGRGVNLQTAQGSYFYPETNYADSKYFSFAFDPSSNFWFSYSDDSQIHISFISGNSKTNYTFGGMSPQLFHNSILTTGNKDMFCFYSKSDTNIYFKKASENFSTERVAYSGDAQIRRLHHVRKLDGYYYRYGIFFMDQEGNGSEVISAPFAPLILQKFNSMENETLGSITNLFSFELDHKYTSGSFIPMPAFVGDDFETTPTGVPITTLTSGRGMGVGYFLHG